MYFSSSVPVRVELVHTWVAFSSSPSSNSYTVMVTPSLYNESEPSFSFSRYMSEFAAEDEMYPVRPYVRSSRA